MISLMAMISLSALAGDLSSQFAGVNVPEKPVYLCLTMILREALTIKIYPAFTINVPSSFAFKTESATRSK